MAVQVRFVWDNAAIKILQGDPRVRHGEDRLAAGAVLAMKAHCPVSKPGIGHQSGTLRSSIKAARTVDHGIIIGPTASYAGFVNDGTPPHIIRSKGPWPLRNPETGQVFGQEVHHPGTRATHFIEAAARELNGVRLHI